MRKGTVETFNAWLAGKSRHPRASVWTNGETVYSYGTPILVKRDDKGLCLNITRYSVTTTNHQNGLRQLLTQHGVAFTEREIQDI